MNIAAWFFIVIRKPFKVGDRIQIGDISGDVIDQRIIQFTLMEIGTGLMGTKVRVVLYIFQIISC